MVLNDVELASIQIRSLQKIIRCQDQLIETDIRHPQDICNVWKNECYRLSVQKQVAEDESVRIGCLSVDLLQDQRLAIAEAVTRELENCMRDHLHRVGDCLEEAERRLKAIERETRKVEARMGMSSTPERSLLDCENSYLRKRNSDLEEHVRLLEKHLALREMDNERLNKEVSENAKRLQTPKKLKDVAVTASPGTAHEVHLLLAELKALETEAQQMLIKP